MSVKEAHPMSLPATAPAKRPALDSLLRPQSIAIVGASANARSLGNGVFSNLERAGFPGEIHLVNPKRAEINGRPCVASVDDLPLAVDCAILAIPGAGVMEAVRACARRQVRSVIIFSSGFAESGPQGRADQEEIGRIAREHDMAVEGPNCLGLVNYVDATPLTFVSSPVVKLGERPGIALISQSGAMAAVLGVSLRTHGMNLSYSVSTGNEAANTVEDYVEYLIEDEHTPVIALLVEQFRQPRKFLEMIRRSRELGKHIVLLHPGRSSGARASAATHTGAMAGNYEAMCTIVAHAGVVVVDTLEELVDVSQLLICCSSLPRGGAAVLMESGAFKALTLDFCESIGLELPALSSSTDNALRQTLPEFIIPSNPFDMTAQTLVEPDEIYQKVIVPMLSDDHYGSLVLSIILTDRSTSGIKFPPIIKAIKAAHTAKPVIFAGVDEGADISPAYVEELRGMGVPFFPTSERALRALARLTDFTAKMERDQGRPGMTLPRVALPASGTMAEYMSKEVLAAAGIPVPAGALARTLDEAKNIAARIHYPVVLKAQAASLTHKSDFGGVILNVADADALASGWKRLHDDIARALPELVLEGVLVEKMGQRGAELIVGAKNDKDWGPLLLVGFGGVLAEALKDVRLLPPDLSVEAIVEELYRLKSAPLLRGFRGSPALDVRAAAEIVCRLGTLMLSNPAIQEVDINPVVVYPEGQGALALDALIVVE
jgi:acyl-CoA synthetase (NDP forming)